MILVRVDVDKCQRALDNIKTEKRKVDDKVALLRDKVRNEKTTKFFGLITVAKYSPVTCICEVERIIYETSYLNPTERNLLNRCGISEKNELDDALRFLSGEETSLIVSIELAKLVNRWA